MTPVHNKPLFNQQAAYSRFIATLKLRLQKRQTSTYHTVPLPPLISLSHITFIERKHRYSTRKMNQTIHGNKL